MKIVLLLFLYFSYYGVKGFMVKKTVVRAILMTTVLSLWYAMYTLVLGFSGAAELVLKLFLVFSLITYLLRSAGLKLPSPPLFSVFEINQENFELKYLVFKPGFLLLTNIYCALKKIPLIRFSDVIEVDVKVSNKQIVLLKI